MSAELVISFNFFFYWSWLNCDLIRFPLYVCRVLDLFQVLFLWVLFTLLFYCRVSQKKSSINWTGEGKSTSSQEALPEFNPEETKQEKRRIYMNLFVISSAFLLKTRCFFLPLSSLFKTFFGTPCRFPVSAELMISFKCFLDW